MALTPATSSITSHALVVLAIAVHYWQNPDCVAEFQEISRCPFARKGRIVRRSELPLQNHGFSAKTLEYPTWSVSSAADLSLVPQSFALTHFLLADTVAVISMRSQRQQFLLAPYLREAIAVSTPLL